MNRRKNDFNYSRLCEIVSRLNTRLLEIVKRDRKGLISDKEIVLVEKRWRIVITLFLFSTLEKLKEEDIAWFALILNLPERETHLRTVLWVLLTR